MKANHYLLSILAIAVMMSGPVHAGDNGDPRIRALEDAVRSLQQRVASLEAQLHQQSAPIHVASAKEPWRKLRRGMSGPDVEALLGSPTKVDHFGSFIVWHYGDYSGGQVEFESNSETVKAWHEPD